MSLPLLPPSVPNYSTYLICHEVDVPRQQDDQHAADEHDNELCEEERVGLEHRRGFWREMQPVEGIGSGECLAHGDGLLKGRHAGAHGGHWPGYEIGSRQFQVSANKSLYLARFGNADGRRMENVKSLHAEKNTTESNSDRRRHVRLS